MRQILTLAVVVACAMFATAIAKAETIDAEVRANSSQSVYTLVYYETRSCRPSTIPALFVRKQPAHGKVSFRKRILTLDARSGRCAGTKVKGAEIVYTPQRGYRGADAFTVAYHHQIYSNAAYRTLKTIAVSVTVR